MLFVIGFVFSRSVCFCLPTWFQDTLSCCIMGVRWTAFLLLVYIWKSASGDTFLLGQKLNTFVTKYQLDTFSHGQHGLTFKTEQKKNATKFKELTMCFRVNIDYFVSLGDYGTLLEIRVRKKSSSVCIFHGLVGFLVHYTH